MKNKVDLDAVIVFRKQGLLWGDIAKMLNVETSVVKRICLSKKYKKRYQEWLLDSKGAMDSAFNNYAQVVAGNSLKLYEKALEMVDSESPRVQLEGLKLAYQMTKDSRGLMIDERIVAMEETLANLESDG